MYIFQLSIAMVNEPIGKILVYTLSLPEIKEIRPCANVFKFNYAKKSVELNILNAFGF